MASQDIQKEKQLLLKNMRIRTICVSVIMLAAVIVLAVFGVRNIANKLFEERADSLVRTTREMGENINTVFRNRWDDVYFLAEQFYDYQFDTPGEAYAQMSRVESYLEVGNDHIIFLDDSGICHTSAGETFTWYGSADPNEAGEHVYVTVIDCLEPGEGQMLYFASMPEPKTVGDLTFTHIGLVCNAGGIESVLNVSNMGVGSNLFIVDADGYTVYYRNAARSLPNNYNIFEACQPEDFGYDTSREAFVEDVQNRDNGCAYLKLDSGNYFMSYYPLRVNDWTLIMMVPGAFVGTGTVGFTQAVLVFAFLLMVFIIVVVAMILSYVRQYALKHQTLINERLKNAVKAEKEANNTKTQFLSAMTHDIKEPLNNIIRMVEFTQNHLYEPEVVKEGLNDISLSGGRLVTLVNDILDISRMDSGRMFLQPTTFSVKDMFIRLENMVRPLAEEKKLDFAVTVHAIEHEYVFADELRLDQIYLNLMNNAVKFTRPGGRVRVDFIEMPNPVSNKMTLAFRISDNGIGMTEEYMEHMYDSFTRAVDGRIDAPGMGLGLTICKRLVDIMGGSIDCKSQIGKGTLFTVILDLEIAERLDDTAYVESDDTYSIDLNGKCVLVAEDDDRSWITLEEMLKDNGIRAERAENGRVAVSKLQRSEAGTYDLVLMSVKLPVMDGCQASAEIRKTKREDIRTIPIVGIMGEAFAEEFKRCVDSGMNGFVSKQPDVRKLLFELRKAIEESQKN